MGVSSRTRRGQNVEMGRRQARRAPPLRGLSLARSRFALLIFLQAIAAAFLVAGGTEPLPLEERVRRLVEDVGRGPVAKQKGEGNSLEDDVAARRARRVLSSLPRAELLEVLGELGYTGVDLGPYEQPPGSDDTSAGGEEMGGVEEGKENDGEALHIRERHLGQYCQTEVAHHMTVPVGTPLPSVFVEEDASVVAQHHAESGGHASDSAASEPVSCACDEFDCTCRKQCFCKTQSEPFPTSQPKACPVCKNCDGTPVPKADGDDDDTGSGGIPDKPNPPPHEFKCSCSFDGGGGSKMGSKNAMDCDCKVSDCSCVRKCKCRAPGS